VRFGQPGVSSEQEGEDDCANHWEGKFPRGGGFAFEGAVDGPETRGCGGKEKEAHSLKKFLKMAVTEFVESAKRGGRARKGRNLRIVRKGGGRGGGGGKNGWGGAGNLSQAGKRKGRKKSKEKTRLFYSSRAGGTPPRKTKQLYQP